MNPRKAGWGFWLSSLSCQACTDWKGSSHNLLEIGDTHTFCIHPSFIARQKINSLAKITWFARALVNIHSNRCHMIKPIVFELSLYQLKISGSELTVSVMSKWPASGKEKGNPVFDCLPKRAFRAYFATRDCSALFHSKIVCFGHIMTRFVQSRRLKVWDR